MSCLWESGMITLLKIHSKLRSKKQSQVALLVPSYVFLLVLWSDSSDVLMIYIYCPQTDRSCHCSFTVNLIMYKYHYEHDNGRSESIKTSLKLFQGSKRNTYMGFNLNKQQNYIYEYNSYSSHLLTIFINIVYWIKAKFFIILL